MTTDSIVTIIRHHHNQTELQDVVTTHLTHLGFDVRHRYPFDGDLLSPEPEHITPTVVLGGSQCVTDIEQHQYLEQELQWIKTCLLENVPILGICLGAQLMAHALGARVSAREPEETEFGFYTVTPTEEGKDWLAKPTVFMQAHFQEFSLPEGAVCLASSERFKQQAFRYGHRALAIQFHPEVTSLIHKDWLADTWSDEMAAVAGAQSKNRQRQEAPNHLHDQNRWLEATLEKLFEQ